MAGFEADRVPHRTRDLCAYDAFHLLRKLEPILPATLALDLVTDGIDADRIVASLGGMKPAEITTAFTAAAAAAERDDGQGWAPARKDVPLPDMIVIVLAVVEANFAAYLDRRKPAFKPTPSPRLRWEPALMPDGESWLFRPCRSDPPLIDMLALFDGRVSLFHVAKANDILDLEAENETRAMAAAERKR